MLEKSERESSFESRFEEFGVPRKTEWVTVKENAAMLHHHHHRHGSLIRRQLTMLTGANNAKNEG